jgi:tetratricopeptide (TPR) repeat protein
MTTAEVRDRIEEAFEEAPELRDALQVFTVLRESAGDIDAARVGDACERVYAWAESKAMMQTAVHFAEAAARADDLNPRRASVAGRICRRAAMDQRSAAWFYRAFRLAVRMGGEGSSPEQRAASNRESVRALLGYGALLKSLGRHFEARGWLERAGRRARQTGQRRRAAEAHHDLLAIAAEIGTYAAVERHAKLAFDLYPLSDERLPYLVHDYAYLLVRERYYSLALPLLDQLARVIVRADQSVLVLGTLARAAAGAGRHGRFRTLERMLLPLTLRYEEFAAPAFIHLAEGARAFGDWAGAERYADAARQLAERRNDALIRRDAQALLERIAGHAPPEPEESPPDPDRLAFMIRRFVARLSKVVSVAGAEGVDGAGDGPPAPSTA